MFYNSIDFSFSPWKKLCFSVVFAMIFLSILIKNFMNISDQQLYEQFKKYGELARTWRNKFLGLLPEVYRRRLHEKKGFGTIYEFAAKLAGVSKEQVHRVLNLEKRFEDKPMLKEMLTKGEVSVNKLARIVSIATQENQEVLAAQVKMLSNRALETLVRDEKSSNDNSLQKGLFEDQSVHVHTFHLSEEVQQKLLELEEKGLDANAILLELLKKRELEIVLEKEQLFQEQVNTDKKPSRTIPAKVKRLIKKEYGTKCSIPTCQKPLKIIHHTQRYALSRNHDPHFLAPLCKEHHAIAHAIDVKVQRKRQFVIKKASANLFYKTNSLQKSNAFLSNFK
jgi:hypothetical protein